MTDYRRAGLSALARVGNSDEHPWFFGHVGAAVLAGAFLLDDPDLSDEVRQAIAVHLDQRIGVDAAFFAAVEGSSGTASEAELVEALSGQIGVQAAVGHGTIFLSIALRAVREAPALFTREVCDGLVALLHKCLDDPGDRFLGIPDYRDPALDLSGRRTFGSVTEAAEYALSVHDRVFPDQFEGDQAWFLAGNRLHALTGAHALVELDELGYPALAAAGLDVLSRDIYLSLREYDHLDPLQVTTTLDPRELSFWQRPLDEPHHIKLAWSALCLTRDWAEPDRGALFHDLNRYWGSYP